MILTKSTKNNDFAAGQQHYDRRQRRPTALWPQAVQAKRPPSPPSTNTNVCRFVMTFDYQRAAANVI